MREMGLPSERFRRTTDSKHDHPIAPNVLGRNFEAERPNQFWVTDITYIRTGKGWLYLAVILDLFSRRVIGWAMQLHLRIEFPIDLEMHCGRFQRTVMSYSP